MKESAHGRAETAYSVSAGRARLEGHAMPPSVPDSLRLELSRSRIVKGSYLQNQTCCDDGWNRHCSTSGFRGPSHAPCGYARPLSWRPPRDRHRSSAAGRIPPAEGGARSPFSRGSSSPALRTQPAHVAALKPRSLADAVVLPKRPKTSKDDSSDPAYTARAPG